MIEVDDLRGRSRRPPRRGGGVPRRGDRRAFAPPDWFGREVTEDGALQEPRARGGRAARMSYRLEPGEGVADGIRRIVAEELDDAIAGLRRGAGDGRGRDKAIHEARKSLKKSRSALRLARDDLKRRRAATRARRCATRAAGCPGRATRRSCSTPSRRWRTRCPRRRPRRSARCSGSSRTRRDGARGPARGRRRAAGGRGRRARGDPRARRGLEARDQGCGSVAEGAEILYARGREAMREALRDGDDETGTSGASG